MEEIKETDKSEAHLTSVAAFVEGGIQDACDDACSICLESFCDSDPSTVTNCKHEFHLQCVLEWCQRSSQCPMCWQPMSLKEPSSQELLEAVEHERNIRLNPPRNSAIFHHPTLGDFELQHLPVGINDAELEERIIQHLAAAAAMGRRRIARREGHRIRSSAQARPQFLVFSTHPNSPPSGPMSSSATQREEVEPTLQIAVATPPSLAADVEEESSRPSRLLSSEVQADQASASVPESSGGPNQQGTPLNNRGSPNQPSANSQERAGPSESQSFAETLKLKFNAISTRYKESISKSTRGWKERFFSRNSNTTNLGSEVRQEADAGIATLSHMIERLDTRDNSRSITASVSNSAENGLAESRNQQTTETSGDNSTGAGNVNVQTTCPASSGSN